MDISKDKVVGQILSLLCSAKAAKGPVRADGIWGSFARLLAAHIHNELKRPVLYICAHIDDADNASDDFDVFAGFAPMVFPASEETPDEFADAADQVNARRTQIVVELAQAQKRGGFDGVICTCVQALNQPVPGMDVLKNSNLALSLDSTIAPEMVVGWLCDNGFERVDSVDMPGQFARRGGIIDIFAPVAVGTFDDSLSAGTARAEPIRVEFFGDRIESIRRINLDTQRSADTLTEVCIVSTFPPARQKATELFVNLFPAETIIILEEPAAIQEVSELFLHRIDNPAGLYPWEAIYRAMSHFAVLEISRFAGPGWDDYLHLDVASVQQFEHASSALWKDKRAVLDELVDTARDREVLLYCENAAEIERITQILKDTSTDVPKSFQLKLGFIHHGFIVNSLNTVVITHHEIFSQFSVRRRIRALPSVSPVDTLSDLKKGDYVVHVSYGIGKFSGICTMEKNGTCSEYLTLEFADRALVHVPVSSICLVQKYIGSMPKRPILSKVGSKKWQMQKQRVAEGVQELAEELLDIQAKRKSLGGFAFGTDSLWQREFEESFLYDETPDQITTAGQIKYDMTQPVAMDRLLCGDVGYGKTELAMRAAFKAAENGKQVAVLVPTTVLCVQHGRTFAERFADFPLVIETLNRFTPSAQAKDIIKRTAKGGVDVLIGTHRLLSDDVGFKDLGLLIIDEEQRFGVEHKERLKRFRVNIDVLTMTATPIPRTLHLSLLGLRDISSLATPPLDRRSIVTKICRFSHELIRKAILHELNRQGQVFFVHNRVRTIERTAEQLKKIVADPAVRFGIAHGQMHKHQLEDAMIDFVTGRTDILVCSTIIESGLDIPNANTMLINDADRFGLAQLHQLRGRVGRYKNRAYAYMLLPASRTVTPLAAKRLKAIEEYSQLGAGFRIALRDLEIRGAGNILGPEQSGHINAVGYEMYCRLLSEAVKRLKNEPVHEPPSVVIDLGISTYIPKSYISSDSQRMDVYRRIASAADARELGRLREELADLFGQVPKEVKMLIDIAELRILAAPQRIKSIVVSGRDLIFSFDSAKGTADLFAAAPGIVRIPDAKTVHLRLEKNYFEPLTLLAVLRKILTKKRQ